MDVTKATQILRIIVLTIAMGLAAYAGWVLYQGHEQHEPMLTWFAVAFTVVAVAARFALPPLIVSPALIAKLLEQWAENPPPDVDPVVAAATQAYQMRTLATAFILDAPGFFCVFAYQQEGQLPALICVGVLLATLLTLFPTETGMQAWVDSQLAQLEQETEQKRSASR